MVPLSGSKSQDDGQDYDWGAVLGSWPDPEQDWAGDGFTRRNEESAT